jgi:hypothetical protein
MTEVANARDDFRAMIKDLIKSGKPLVDAEGNPIRSNAAYHPERLKNNETKAELLMRSKYLLRYHQRSGLQAKGNVQRYSLSCILI